LIRYELILTRCPEVSIEDIPHNLGGLPPEFSAWTLKRLLEGEGLGRSPVAWGNERAPLLVIKQRVSKTILAMAVPVIAAPAPPDAAEQVNAQRAPAEPLNAQRAPAEQLNAQRTPAEQVSA